ncbi:galactoside 2-alpha-L-fucosyltransferase SEC1-like [Mytilus trossulus]|uniref:galactoside 2-alpha-L-fucosyltransferase SEC1-like n=1 Tax=Mytilus trossulus TaxID=6551 RepID=UPI003003E872
MRLPCPSTKRKVVSCAVLFSLLIFTHHYLFYEPPGYICPYFRGRLGNLMFIYASVYGIAKSKGMVLVVDTSDIINTVFPNLNALAVDSAFYFCNSTKLVYERRACAYDIDTTQFNNRKNTTLKAYLQSWKYFKNVEKEIRRQFVFKQEVQDKAQAIINNYTREYIQNRNITNTLQIIGVHIRRGDYLKPGKVAFGYKVATKSYLNKAFKFFRSKFKNCLFLIFTAPNREDLKWRKYHMNGSDVINVDANERDVDMCALSKCNHTIITVGSFGWWSAWLNKGMTIYFNDVVRPNSYLSRDFSNDMKDYFPSSWIGMQ